MARLVPGQTAWPPITHTLIPYFQGIGHSSSTGTRAACKLHVSPCTHPFAVILMQEQPRRHHWSAVAGPGFPRIRHERVCDKAPAQPWGS
uniref:Uncharacterized protein n=1 Tax=Dunaliella tertiolecta TaxID=3047 RepID=A0A7S3VN23_DUNTE